MKKFYILLFLASIVYINGIYAQTWTVLSTGVSETLYGITPTSQNSCFATGDNGRVIITSNQGASWTSQQLSLVSGDNMRCCTATGSNTWYVAGGNGVNIDSYIYNTNNAGASWSLQINPTPHGFYGISFSNTNTGFAVRGNTTSSVIYKTLDGGVSWNLLSSSSTSTWMSNILAIDANKIICIGHSGTIQKTLDGGSTWSTSVVGASDLAGIAFPTLTIGYICGSAGKLLKTTDGGTTWNTITTIGTSAYLYSLAFLDANHGFVVGANGAIFYTADGGTSWTNQSGCTSNTLIRVGFFDQNLGYACGANGTVIKYTAPPCTIDTIAPVPNVLPLPNATGQCSVSVSAPTATDACAGTIIAYTSDPTSYNTQGTYNITWTYDDGNGNSVNQNQTVIVDDITNPVPNIVSLPNVTGQCSATVTAPPTATDNCTGTITGTTSAPLTYTSQGTHVITWIYNDGNGNITTQIQNVIVDDITSPVPDIATLPTVTGQCSATVTAPTATDNCAGTITGTTTAPLTYTTQGSHVIVWSYNDGNGNITTQTQNVIIDDITSPVPDIATLPTVTGQCSVTVSIPTATDNCVGTITGTTTAPLTYSVQGTYVITWTYNDGNGNITTQTQTIIVDDTTNPVPNVATLPNVTGECSATVTSPTATDNCVGTITGTTSDPLNYFSQGTYVITWTYDDGNGNVVTQNQNVIVDDVTDPVPTLATLPDITGECSATITTTPTAGDNCSGTVIATTNDPLSYNSQGTHIITWTYNDGNGNIVTQTQNVIINDITLPTFVCPTNLVSCFGATLNIAPTSVADNCGGAVNITYNLSGATVGSGVNDASSDLFNLGITTVTYYFNDGQGNTGQCSFDVTINSVDTSVTLSGATLTANAAGTYQWYNCSSGTIIPGAASASYTATVNGMYAVIVSQNGCTDTSSCYTITNAGIEENSFNLDIEVYPNPTNGEVNIDFQNIEEPINIDVFDTEGKLMFSLQDVRDKHTVLNLKEFSSGVYFLKLYNNKAQKMIRLNKF